MKRFIVTSPYFVGEAEIFYNELGVLVKIDVGGAKMPTNIIASFKKAVPVIQADIATAFANTHAVVVEADLVVTFEMFWESYDMKRNKKPAEDLWKKLSKNNQVIAFYSIKAYNKYCHRNKWYTKMYPDTYLRKEHFNDEWDKL